jgi:hypothetical protein
MPILAMTTIVIVMPPLQASSTAPPATQSSTTAPTSTNDLLPDNDVTNCVGTVERANCGSRARADGHTYLVFLALAAGMTFIGWRIAHGVRAREKSHEPAP